jgi:hypothetical protein
VQIVRREDISRKWKEEKVCFLIIIRAIGMIANKKKAILEAKRVTLNYIQVYFNSLPRGLLASSYSSKFNIKAIFSLFHNRILLLAG